jgi:hypothetical protein
METWVFRGGAHKGDSPVFDIGEKGILLGFVETVDFVDEDDASLVEERLACDVLNDFAQVSNAAEDSRESTKVHVKGTGVKTGKGGLSAAGRAPKKDG